MTPEEVDALAAECESNVAVAKWKSEWAMEECLRGASVALRTLAQEVEGLRWERDQLREDRDWTQEQCTAAQDDYEAEVRENRVLRRALERIGHEDHTPMVTRQIALDALAAAPAPSVDEAEEARRRIRAGGNPLANLTPEEITAARASDLPEVLGAAPAPREEESRNG